MVEIFTEMPEAPKDYRHKASGNMTNDLIEGAYNLNRKELYRGYRKIQADLGKVFLSIRKILSEILTNEVSGSYKSDILQAKKSLSEAESHIKTLWNPNGISGLSILGSTSVTDFTKFKIQRYEEMKSELEMEFETHQRKFEAAAEDIRQAIEDCESLLGLEPSVPQLVSDIVIPVDRKLIALFGTSPRNFADADEEKAA